MNELDKNNNLIDFIWEFFNPVFTGRGGGQNAPLWLIRPPFQKLLGYRPETFCKFLEKHFWTLRSISGTVTTHRGRSHGVQKRVSANFGQFSTKIDIIS